MLGAGPQDEDPIPAQIQIQGQLPFDFFGLGQQVAGQNDNGQQDQGPVQIGGAQNDVVAPQENNNWLEWPDELPAAQQGHAIEINLNDPLPIMMQDLNALPEEEDPQEVLIYPGLQNNIAPNNWEMIQAPNQHQEQVIHIDQLAQPEHQDVPVEVVEGNNVQVAPVQMINEENNFLPLEIQEEDLMNDEEIEEAANEQLMDWQLNGQANIQIGMVRIIDNIQPFNLSSPYPFVNGRIDLNKLDSSIEWGKNDNVDFSKKDQPLDLAVCPSENPINISESTLIRVPKKWAEFFQVILNSPVSYEWAKNLLQSNFPAVFCKSGESTEINISAKPNDHNSKLYTRLDSLNSYVVPEEAMLYEEEPPVTPKSKKKLKKVKNQTPVVESEVRRSIRVRGNRMDSNPVDARRLTV